MALSWWIALLLLPTTKDSLPLSGFPLACNETLQAVPDTTLCHPGGTVQLNAVFSGNTADIIEILWEPPDGLSDPSIIDPTATVSQTTTYSISVSIPSGPNLITNGTFESGNTGFTSSYFFGNPGLSPGGYSIQNNPQNSNGSWSACGDHTSGSGNMMLVDGATSPGVKFYCHTLSVLPNTNYVFELYVASIYPVSTGIVEVEFNGTVLGTVDATTTPCEWVKFSAIWNSGNTSSLTICLEDLNIQGFGNDFAVDDIFLREVCEYTDSITIEVLPEIVSAQSHTICQGETVSVGNQTFSNGGQFEVVLQSYQGCDSIINLDIEVISVDAEIIDPLPINCLLDESELDGSLSAAPYGISSYFWSTLNGTIQGNPSSSSVTAASGGTFQLKVSSTANGVTCYDSTSVTVAVDTIPPAFSIETPTPLACDDSITSLQAIVINAPPDALFAWDSQQGIILAGQGTPNPTVQGLGTYTLVLTDPSNGCSAERSVEVVGDTLRPRIEADPAPPITCRDSTVNLSARVITPASGYTAEWFTSDGIILDANGLKPTVGAPGTYTLVVTNTATGCSAQLDIIVGEDRLPPLIDLPPADTLRCGQDSLDQPPSVIPALDASFLWSTLDGILLSPPTDPQPRVGGPGTYNLIVEFNQNGCRDTASINLSRHPDPIADAGPDLSIDCLNDSLLPASLGSQQTPGILYSWSLNGAPVDSSLQPLITQPGTWVLSLLDTLTLCSASDTLLVADIRKDPLASIATPPTLTCTDTVITLDASASDFGHHSYDWSGPGLLAGADGQMSSANAPGTYILLLTDTLNRCFAADTVTILQDVNPPSLSIAAPDSLDCNTLELSLEASASSSGGAITFAWSTIDGNILSGADSPNPIVNAGGTYSLTVTSLLNGCSASASVFVFRDPNLPSASVDQADTLTCLLTSLVLNASYSAPSGNVAFNWSTSGGNILSGANSLNPVIDKPGTYLFTLTDLASGCETSDQVNVPANTQPLPGLVATPDILTCRDSLVTIALATAPAADVLWSSLNGQFAGPANTFSTSVSKPGIYSVRWTDPANGCSDSTSVLVAQNIDQPWANTGPDAVIPCDPRELTLDGSASGGKGPLTFLWSTNDGALLSAPSDVTVSAGSPGTYYLLVTDQINGCSNRDTTLLYELLPQGLVFNISPPGCRREQGILEFLGASGGTPPYSLQIDNASTLAQGGEALLKPGTWPVSIIDAYGCRFDTSLVMPQPQDLSLTNPSEVWVTYGDSGLIQLSTNFPPSDIDTVIWDPFIFLSPSADPLAWYTHATLAMQYRVTVRSIDGCEADGLIQVLIVNDPLVYVPNVFSPGNDDGNNDRFFPQTKPGSVRSIRSMAVYDRWGTQLFLATDFPPDEESFGWDGRFRGVELDPAVFVWVIEAELNTGERILLKGDVALMH